MLNILAAIFIVWSVVTTFDFLAYIIQSAPKHSIFAVWTWYVGFILWMVLIYWQTSGTYVW